MSTCTNAGVRVKLQSRRELTCFGSEELKATNAARQALAMSTSALDTLPTSTLQHKAICDTARTVRYPRPSDEDAVQCGRSAHTTLPERSKPDAAVLYPLVAYRTVTNFTSVCGKPASALLTTSTEPSASTCKRYHKNNRYSQSRNAQYVVNTTLDIICTRCIWRQR